MRNRQQLLDEISSEIISSFGAPTTRDAEKKEARGATWLETVLGASHRRSDEEVYASSALELSYGPPCAAQSGDARTRVLIIENDAILRFSLEALAEAWGVDALAATDGEDALRQANRAEMRFDAIISDYRLGPGMNGAQVVQELEQRAGRRFPALILTGETSDASLTDIARSGIALAHKPITEEELRERLSALLS